MICTSQYHSPLGEILIAGSGNALTGLWFYGQKYFGENLPEKTEENELPVFVETKQWLDLYFRGKEPDFTPLLSWETTPFRRAVWEILLTIPYGQTVTYGEIARRIARQKGIPKMSARAVGTAIGHNPVSIIVPCHRVVGSNGNLTGYAAGLEKKIRLLALEKANESFFAP